jgi:hypothetical protein
MCAEMLFSFNSVMSVLCVIKDSVHGAKSIDAPEESNVLVQLECISLWAFVINKRFNRRFLDVLWAVCNPIVINSISF